MAYVEETQFLKVNLDINKELNKIIHKILDYEESDKISSIVENINLNGIDFTKFNVEQFNSDIIFAFNHVKKFKSINKKKKVFEFIENLNKKVLSYYNLKSNEIKDNNNPFLLL